MIQEVCKDDHKSGSVYPKTERRTRQLSAGLVDLSVKLQENPDTVYDVVIVGSGYGGSVAAQHLAGLEKSDIDGNFSKDITVCVLERGSEYLPGMFPSTFAELPGHVRYGAQETGIVTGKQEGLFDIRIGQDVSALVANGLGGGSLINAGVMAKPKFDQFDSRMPKQLEKDLQEVYLDQALKLLINQPLQPGSAGNTIKSHPCFSQSISQFPLKFHRLSELGKSHGVQTPAVITVAMKDQQASEHSTNLSQCTNCGDCMTGCNTGAKASLDTNLLAQAKRDKAEIYTGASVLSIHRNGQNLWVLEIVHTSAVLRMRESNPIRLMAHKVILAAGTLGSTEILLRSRSDKLVFSNVLGERFSCNGDNIAAIHGLQLPAKCSADEYVALAERSVGPTITNMLEVPAHGKQLGFLIQEFSVPAPVKRLFSEIVTTGAALANLSVADMLTHGNEVPGDLDPCAVNDAAIEKTLLVGLIGHDEADGSLRLPLEAARVTNATAQEGTLQIVWPQARNGEQINAAYERLREYVAKSFTGAKVIANPMWRLLPKGLKELVTQPLGPVLTVHPLGGCPIGVDDSKGVVDDCGRVFNSGDKKSQDWQGSLIVLDGSIIPSSLGANPALTISAVALRAVQYLAVEWGFGKDQTQQILPKENLLERTRFSQAKPSTTVKPESTIVVVTERLLGEVKLHSGKSLTEKFIVELTLSYKPFVLKDLMSTWQKRTLEVTNDALHKSYIRIFNASDWNAGPILRVADDNLRDQKAIYTAPLEGTLRFLHREKSNFLGRHFFSLYAYIRNRGLRDFYQSLADKNTKSFFGKLLDALKMASKAGEIRRFDYQLFLGQSASLSNDPYLAKFLENAVVEGHKRITYNRRANPWQQMMELSLTRFPGMAQGVNPILKLDTSFVAKQGIPLFQIKSQKNQPNALLDMASFGLFMTRLMLSIHIWTFRKPDTLHDRLEPVRLPCSINGLPEPLITELTVSVNLKGIGKTNAVVRLTRYPRFDSTCEPLAMIHGYSVSGTTFTHPSLQPCAAEYFWHKGRDVWIIDLRTSSGMPTAKLPWSYEEVALIDIPAALLHIKNVTSKKVDVIAHCIGAAMLSMAILTDARQIRSGEVQLGVDAWITQTQLGMLSAFNGDGGARSSHPTINAVVLSQKGPLLRYTDANILRAYFMRPLRRWLMPGEYQFRPPNAPKFMDQLMDRLLSSMPYPPADYDVENPLWPWVNTAWTASRHRMDALYARDFSAENLSAETLNAIDDLFGPINLDTIAQTIHFVRFNCITNRSGRGEFATIANIKKRWIGIPTFAIHGADNGLVDVSTNQLLENNFRAAGVPFASQTLKGYGHQDVFIGKNSKIVFDKLEKFLHTPLDFCTESVAAHKQTVTSQPCDWRFDVPWIGPRVGNRKTLRRMYALSSPKFGMAKLALIPVAQTGQYVRCGTVVMSRIGDSRHWLSLVMPSLFTAGYGNLQMTGWLAVIAYQNNETTIGSFNINDANGTSVSQPPNAEMAAPPESVGANGTTFTHPADASLILTRHKNNNIFLNVINLNRSVDQQLDFQIDAWLGSLPNDLSSAFISIKDAESWSCDLPRDFSFALGSCQYPPGLLDKPVAEQSMKALSGALKDASKPLDFVVFAGDQIYADATAGLVDPVRSDERYDLPYEAALRSNPMRAIMRSMPVHMLLDDHELIDNWEPTHPDNKFASDQTSRIKRQGLKAYWKYQRLASGKRAVYRDVSYDFTHRGTSVYMLDTRSQRQPRPVGQPQLAQLFPERQMQRLKDWLKLNPHQVKFIVSPSILLPLHLGMLNESIDQTTRSDAWEGYPSQVENLFGFIVDNNIDNVVFLSGDEHLCCAATATLSKEGKSSRTIASVHASGLYAPFPFANSKVEDFIDVMDSQNFSAVNCVSAASFAPSTARFARLSVEYRGVSSPVVSVEFIDGNGSLCFKMKLI